MYFRFLNLLFALCICAAACVEISAQADASTPSGRPSAIDNADLPDTFREGLAKRRIQAEEKEYKDLIQNGEEAFKISEELQKNFEAHKNLTADDSKKIEKLEKVVKKIREDLGAKDDSEVDDEDGVKPSSLKSAISNIKSTTSDLLSELKKTTRHSISVLAVQSSNNLLKLVRFAKFNKD